MTGSDEPFAAEAMRLVSQLQDAAQQWSQQAFAESPDGHTGSECQWCPLCQFVSVLRGERPEVTERVAEAGVAVLSALRGLLDAAAGAMPDERGGAHRAPAAAGAAGGVAAGAAEAADAAEDGTPPRVQHIRLGGQFDGHAGHSDAAS
jgi:hypothetical protein